jgi:hypothetical protein
MTQRPIIMHERMVLSYFSGRLSPCQTRPQQALARFPAVHADKALRALADLAHKLSLGRCAWIAAAAKVVTAGPVLARYAQNSAAAAGSEECVHTSVALPFSEWMTWTTLS